MVSERVMEPTTAVSRQNSLIQLLAMKINTFIQEFEVQPTTALQKEKEMKQKVNSKPGGEPVLHSPLKETVIWDSRWQALKRTLDQTIAHLEQNKKEDWETTLESTLKCLRAFGEKQFEFFYCGFQDGRLLDSPQYKAEYALRQTLDQIAFDLAALQRIYSQRDAADYNRVARQTLDLADKLAYRAMQPAIQASLLEPTTVLTYFQKAAHVRVIPYAPVAFIGIPYTCTGIFDSDGELVQDAQTMPHTARDFLATAHEVGHHVFWHGKQGNVPIRSLLRSRLTADPAWRMDWLEEIFADVYGALVAGPIIGLAFQDLIYDNPDLLSDDGEHPVDAIRPYVYTDALKKIMGKNGKPKYPKSPTVLEENWTTIRKTRGKMHGFRPGKGSGDNPISLEEARAELNEVIELILEILQPAAAAKCWSADRSDVDKSQYDTFYHEVLTQLDNKDTPPTFQVQPPTSNLQQVTANGSNTIKWVEGKPLVSWFSFFADAHRHNLTLLPETWTTLLEGGGWAAGGPEGDHNPG